jgi:hypothetical protein
VADATLLEKRGVPTACVITHQFTRSGNAMARRNGYPDFKYAMVPHPIGHLKPDQIKQRALEVLPQVIEILGLE